VWHLRTQLDIRRYRVALSIVTFSMASITRKVGSSGKLSPYWRAKFKGPDGRTVWLTTKCADSRKSSAIARAWEKAARLAAGWELTQALAQKLMAEVQKIYPHPSTVEITKRLLDQLLHDSIGGEIIGQNFEVFARAWLAGKRGKTASATYDKYTSVVERFVHFLPERRRSSSIASISPGEIERFRDSELKSGKTANTVGTSMVILAGLFNAARRQGAISNNPVEAIEVVPPDSEERIPFTADQIKALLQVADVEWTGMVLFGVHSGLRLGDCAALSWTNIDLAARTLTFEAQKTSRRKKSSEKSTIVCLHGDLLSYLESLPVGDDPRQPLFPSLCAQQSSGRQGLSRSFLSLMAQAGIVAPLGVQKTGLGRQFSKLSFHSLRHSFISRLANVEVSSDVRKGLAGHSNDDVHDRYVHLDLSLQRSAIAKLPSVLS
jgi:integrase